MSPLVLASASPRRRQLLEEAGFEFTVSASPIDETPRAGELPEPHARRLAREKAAAAVVPFPAVVLAADTVVAVDGELLGKPADAAELRRFLHLLGGRTHEVITAVALRDLAGGLHELSVTTQVTFRAVDDEEIAWYWATGEPRDKAGGYALQGRAASFILRIDGSPSAVVGLPLAETIALLARAGVHPAWRMRETDAAPTGR